MSLPNVDTCGDLGHVWRDGTSLFSPEEVACTCGGAYYHFDYENKRGVIRSAAPPIPSAYVVVGSTLDPYAGTARLQVSCSCGCGGIAGECQCEKCRESGWLA